MLKHLLYRVHFLSVIQMEEKRPVSQDGVIAHGVAVVELNDQVTGEEAATKPRDENALIKTYKLRGRRNNVKEKEKPAGAAVSPKNKPKKNKLNEEEVAGGDREKLLTTPTLNYYQKKNKKRGLVERNDQVTRGAAPEKVLKTPHPNQKKKRRGADAEIVSSYLSSAKGNSAPPPSRFRPRKLVPVFRMVNLDDKDDKRIVGKRVKVYWSGSRRWFTGKIESFHRRKKLHHVVYDDGDKEDLDLKKEKFELQVLPHEDFKIVQHEPKSKKRVKDSAEEVTSEGDLDELSGDSDGHVSHESEGVVSENVD
ncbi:unnamed protein product [Linum trigynum]|uniref:Tudor domain-containing protein n=2 Tax=Linum trigynum TaxID=586398 RepID=A0AAV2GJC4_9ROSI